jgi:2-dehydropantoate 2-reductase
LPCQDGLLGFEQFWGECLTIGVDYLKDASVQEKANQRSKLERLVELLRGGGGECQITDDIQKDRWMKVILCVDLT